MGLSEENLWNLKSRGRSRGEMEQVEVLQTNYKTNCVYSNRTIKTEKVLRLKYFIYIFKNTQDGWKQLYKLKRYLFWEKSVLSFRNMRLNINPLKWAKLYKCSDNLIIQIVK